MLRVVNTIVSHSLGILVYVLTASGFAADGPTAEWRLVRDQAGAANEAETPFNPTIGSLVATAVGPVQFGDRSPHALKLDGDSKAKHRLVVSPNIHHDNLPKQNFTLEAWVRIEKPTEWGGIVGCFQDNGSFERGWLLGYRNSQFCFGLSTASQKRLTYLTSNTMFETGFWYHVTGTYDGKTMTLFVDGKAVATSNDQSGPVAYPEKAPLIIGAYEDDNESYALTGQIERVSLWNRSLQPAEIVNRFQSRKDQFPEIDAVRPNVVDWPTYNRDNQRTGVVDQPLKFPLHLQWVHHQRYAPQPAWPEPAEQDFWHKTFALKPRVIYDRASHLVTVGDRVYFGSSADGTVQCLDTKNGKVVWKFATEGPVRLAPTVVDDRVVFGSDDGQVYCVAAADGRLLWKLRAVDRDRRIPGNERIISVWPVRTGVLVEDNIGYFCAGLFPQQGVYQTAVDIRTGKKLATNKVDMSAQGYLERKSGRLFIATGRDPAGTFVTGLKRRGKGVGREVASIPEEYRYAFIGAKDTRIGGGDGVVAAFDGTSGKKTWSAQVDGKAWSLATARGRLFVSTDSGAVYCFAGDATTSPDVVDRRLPTERPINNVARSTAKQVLAATDLKRGYCLVTDCQTADLSIALANASELQIIARTPAENVDKLRDTIDRASLSNRISVHVADATAGTGHEPPQDSVLPYTDYMFNLVVSDQIANRSTPWPNPEFYRVVRPLGGIVMTGLSASDVHRRGKLKGSGEWTHMYANPGNTVCSQDSIVTGPMDIQWFGRPGPQQMIDRHHRTIAPVWANGRLFIPGDNRVIGADAYNGTQLWNVPVANSRRIGAYRGSSYLVGTDDAVFVAAGGECLVLDAQTGESKMTLKPAERVDEEDREWGFLSVDAGQVFGSTTKPGGIRRGHSLIAINEGTFWDFRPLVCSDSFFAIDKKTGKNTWEYQATSGMLINSSFTIGRKHVYFVESTNAKTNDVANGRIDPRELMGQGSRVVALHRDSGSIAWTKDLDLTSIQHNVHCAFHAGKLVVVGSYNSGPVKKQDSVLYDVNVLDAESGDIAWRKTQRQDTTIGGDHGEQDHHPVIVGDRLYCEPFGYDLHSGEPLASFVNWDKKHRRGCGTISASASSFFFRQSNPTMFDLKTNTYEKVTTATRPGCWINMIPAGGLLLIPEASSGCTCNFAVQTSLAFLPRKQPKTPHNAP
jgi:outer membrane protein assembly factor BamB